MTWRQQAACKDVPTEIFYPAASEITKGRPPTPDTRPDPYAWARRVCKDCPVQFPCLKEAVDTRDHYGFRAGQTPTEIYVLIHGEISEITKQCDWCGVVFPLGKFHNTRTRFCSKECGRAHDRAVWREKRRERGGRSAA